MLKLENISFEVENENSILQLHKDDMFLVFDLDPNVEINWKNISDLQNRLFKIVKFDENGIIVLVRHNFAGCSVDSASPIKSESDLMFQGPISGTSSRL